MTTSKSRQLERHLENAAEVQRSRMSNPAMREVLAPLRCSRQQFLEDPRWPPHGAPERHASSVPVKDRPLGMLSRVDGTSPNVDAALEDRNARLAIIAALEHNRRPLSPKARRPESPADVPTPKLSPKARGPRSPADAPPHLVALRERVAGSGMLPDDLKEDCLQRLDRLEDGNPIVVARKPQKGGDKPTQPARSRKRAAMRLAEGLIRTSARPDAAREERCSALGADLFDQSPEQRAGQDDKGVEERYSQEQPDSGGSRPSFRRQRTPQWTVNDQDLSNIASVWNYNSRFRPPRLRRSGSGPLAESRSSPELMAKPPPSVPASPSIAGRIATETFGDGEAVQGRDSGADDLLDVTMPSKLPPRGLNSLLRKQLRASMSSVSLGRDF